MSEEDRMKKAPAPGREPMRPPLRENVHVLRDASEYPEHEQTGRLFLDKNDFPQGFDLQWISDSVWGHPVSAHRQAFEAMGWKSVHQEDFDEKFRGRWMPANIEGEIKVDGLVLMARPMAWSERAKELDARSARERVTNKEAQLRAGALDRVTLDTRHPSVRNATTVTRYIEPIQVPEK
jgi:hypothetical protein